MNFGQRMAKLKAEKAKAITNQTLAEQLNTLVNPLVNKDEIPEQVIQRIPEL